MNPITSFFVNNIIFILFLYGLSFFVLGLTLALASRQTSQFRFVRAIRPLAAFGFLHSIYEWVAMFQLVPLQSGTDLPLLLSQAFQLVFLVMSFVMLLAFGVELVTPSEFSAQRRYTPLILMFGVWSITLLIAVLIIRPQADQFVSIANVLARYILGIPSALLGTWALMVQQKTFRERGMPQFGRDLVWSAVALFLYGVVGQLFVPATVIAPSVLVNSAAFLQWFGIPVQLYRGIAAVFFTFFMLRALRAFEMENQRRLEKANQDRLAAQAAALKAERLTTQEMERLNKELRLIAHELALLLDLSNVLAEPISLQDKLQMLTEEIVHSLNFPDAGMILLVNRETDTLGVSVASGFSSLNDDNDQQFKLAHNLGKQCVAKEMAVCRHLDGRIFEFPVEEALSLGGKECREYKSPTTMISLPLTARQQIIGSMVLLQPQPEDSRTAFAEFKLMIGISQQLGLSIENARLSQDARKREKLLAELLSRVVGAQESERQRIARELHDATGQSLTAIALGLRGVENALFHSSPEVVEQIRAIRLFGTDALGELRQIISDLRPPQLDDLGLIAAIQWYIQEFKKRYAIEVDFIVEGDQLKIPSEYEAVLFRITQEALTNIAKHANALYVAVTIATYSAQVCLIIEDDGCGFNPEEVLGEGSNQAGWGLLGIIERTLLLGGRHEIDSAPEHGTYIRVSIPLVMEMKDAKNTATTG